MGEILEAVRETQLENEIHNRDEAITFVRNKYPVEKESAS
jgi:hypothetical protein